MTDTSFCCMCVTNNCLTGWACRPPGTPCFTQPANVPEQACNESTCAQCPASAGLPALCPSPRPPAGQPSSLDKASSAAGTACMTCMCAMCQLHVQQPSGRRVQQCTATCAVPAPQYSFIIHAGCQWPQAASTSLRQQRGLQPKHTTAGMKTHDEPAVMHKTAA